MAAPSLKVKLIIGGIGGLAPILTKLLILDADTITSYLQNFSLEFWKFAGYVLWSCILFSAGVFWAFIHKSENNLLKLFQLGIVAPAMIMGTVQSAEMKANHELLKNATKEEKTVESSDNERGSLDAIRPKLTALISAAYAADTRADKKTDNDKKQSSIWNQLMDGALARPVDINVRALAERLDTQKTQLESEKSKVLALEKNVSMLKDEIDQLKTAEKTDIGLLEKINQLEYELKKSEEEKKSIQSELEGCQRVRERLEGECQRVRERLEGEYQRVREGLEGCRRALRECQRERTPEPPKRFEPERTPEPPTRFEVVPR